jgi:hypothetical protein
MASILRVDQIQSANGTPWMSSGYPQRPGQIIECLTSPCDGSTVSGASGVYAWPNVTGMQAITLSYATASGSNIYYTPPTGATKVMYEFSCAMGWADAHAISHWKLFLNGTEVYYARHNRNGYYPEDKSVYRWVFNIGGIDNTNTGRVSSWTTPKLIEMQVRDYGSSDRRYYLHSNQYWDGGGAAGTYFFMPVLTITAIA